MEAGVLFCFVLNFLLIQDIKTFSKSCGDPSFLAPLWGTERIHPSGTEGTSSKTRSYLKGSMKMFMKTLVALKNLKDAHSEFSLCCAGLCTMGSEIHLTTF